jgi:DNA polymerase III epsilon subunit-like protein
MTTRLLFIDTETGGLDPLRCSLLSLGLVAWQEGAVLGSTEIFISEPTIAVDSEAQSIHGIDVDWLRSHGLTPTTAVETIEAFTTFHFGRPDVCGTVPVAGHNVAFDIGFVKRLYRLAGADYDRVFSHRTIDTAGILRFLTIAGILQLEGASSSAAFEYFGIGFLDHARHSALGDAKATALLFTKLVDLVRQVCANVNVSAASG